LLADWGDAKARSLARRRVERDLTEADRARKETQAALADLREAWPGAMMAIGISSDATPPYADAALAVWNSVGVPKASYEREGRSVETIVSDLRNFEHDVFELLNRVAPDLRRLSAQEALTRISERLADMRRMSDSSRRLCEAAARRATNRSALVARLTSTAGTLEEACRATGALDIATLSEAIQRLRSRHNLESERTTLRHHLNEIADGHDENALRLEREGVDFDLLPGAIEREAVQQAQLLKDIAEASAVHHQKERELEALSSGRDAARAAMQRAEAGAELLSVAEGWADTVRGIASCEACHRTASRQGAGSDDRAGQQPVRHSDGQCLCWPRHRLW
jgi:hypothetical protein